MCSPRHPPQLPLQWPNGHSHGNTCPQCWFIALQRAGELLLCSYGPYSGPITNPTPSLSSQSTRCTNPSTVSVLTDRHAPVPSGSKGTPPPGFATRSCRFDVNCMPLLCSGSESDRLDMEPSQSRFASSVKATISMARWTGPPCPYSRTQGGGDCSVNHSWKIPVVPMADDLC